MAALAIKVKEAMGVKNIALREKEITDYVMSKLSENERVVMLEPKVNDRLAIVSFYVLGAHYNLVVRILNDRFGVQTRGGCSCAGTYGHILLNVDHDTSNKITEKINSGDYAEKPGWIRASFHPTMSNKEIEFVVNAIHQVTDNIDEWSQEYRFNPATGDFEHCSLDVKFPELQGFDPMKSCTVDKSSSTFLQRVFG